MYSTNSIHSPVPTHQNTILFRDHQSNRSASSTTGEQNFKNNDTLDSSAMMEAHDEIIVGPSDHYGIHAQFGNFTSNNPSTPTTLDTDSIITTTNLNATASPSNNLNQYHQQQQLHNAASDDHNHLHHQLHHEHQQQQQQNFNLSYKNNFTNINGNLANGSMFENLELQHQQQEQLLKESTDNIKQQQHTSQLLQQYRQQMTANNFSQNQTKVCVFFNSRTPVIFKIPLPIDQVTLADLKQALPSINNPGYKYFFRSNDQEFGDVKEEIQDDDCKLPISRNRIVAWIVTPNGSPADELASRMTTTTTANKSETLTNTTFDQTYTTTTGSRTYDGSSSLISGTDMESTSYLTETEDDDYSETSSSSASQSDATAVRCVTVQLVLTNENFLGLHISDGDHGIVVAEISENSAVALDGRIEPGDKLIQVNDINLEELDNSDAIEVLQAAVKKRGALKLVVAKFEDFSRPKDAIHPIDTAAWVAHAQAITIPNTSHTEDGNSATSSPSFGSNAHDTDRIRPSSAGFNNSNSSFKINKTADIKEIIQHLKFPNYGIDIKDREWLKIKIPKAFLGSQLVNWLERNVYGFSNSREAKKFATKMLKDGFIRDPISKKSFSSKSYYTFTI